MTTQRPAPLRETSWPPSQSSRGDQQLPLGDSVHLDPCSLLNITLQPGALRSPGAFRHQPSAGPPPTRRDVSSPPSQWATRSIVVGGRRGQRNRREPRALGSPHTGPGRPRVQLCPAQPWGWGRGLRRRARVQAGASSWEVGSPDSQGSGTRRGAQRAKRRNHASGVEPLGTGNTPTDSVEPRAAMRGGHGLAGLLTLRLPPCSSVLVRCEGPGRRLEQNVPVQKDQRQEACGQGLELPTVDLQASGGWKL